MVRTKIVHSYDAQTYPDIDFERQEYSMQQWREKLTETFEAVKHNPELVPEGYDGMPLFFTEHHEITDITDSDFRHTTLAEASFWFLDDLVGKHGERPPISEANVALRRRVSALTTLPPLEAVEFIKKVSRDAATRQVVSQHGEVSTRRVVLARQPDSKGGFIVSADLERVEADGILAAALVLRRLPIGAAVQ